MTVETIDIPFVIGSRQIFALPRRLQNHAYSLDQLLGNRSKPEPLLNLNDSSAHGLKVLSAPLAAASDLKSRYPDYIIGGYQRFHRHYIDMSGDFDSYFAGFSGKTRSTLRRKARKLAERGGGSLDIREYRTPDELNAFFADALPLSRRTYQARWLKSGLPEDKEAKARAQSAAEQGNIRAYLLFVDGRAVSYLYLPVHDGVVVYEHLGYDPEFASFSTGTVLQMDVLERLFGEGNFRYFDFTEGDAPHKSMFGTLSEEACSFFLLKPNLGNQVLMGSLTTFDTSMRVLRGISSQVGLDRKLRTILRG